MRKIEQIGRIIEETDDLNMLVEKLLMCFDGINEEQRREFMRQIGAKLDDFKSKSKQFIHPVVRRSVHSQRLAAMGQMAAAISHELRNPLSGIKVAAEYLLHKIKDQPEIIDIIVNIHNEVIFANNIITNILEHARIGKPNLEKGSIKKTVEEAILTIAQQGSFNNIKIEKNIFGDLPLLNFDPLQIRQVFLNLFINSAEAMIGGGTLSIKISQKAECVIAEVSDTGGGIEKSHLEKLFEPFFSTKVKGVGLGLAIAKEIIENHKGMIDVESKLGYGTTFTICLPAGRKLKK
ncbi:MAG: ATP-binding protein [Candidatus Omnitrophota bacterium]